MKSLLLVAAALLTFLSPIDADAQLNNIFSKPGNSQSQAQPQPQPTASNPVKQMLVDSGFDITAENDSAWELQVKYETYTAPVVVYVNSGSNKIWIRLNLVEAPADVAQHSERLLKLLQVSGDHGPGFYSYNSESNMFQIFASLDMDIATAAKLKERVEMIVAQAIHHSEVWDSSQWTTARHIGEWTASMGAQATITINLQANGTFELVNKSSGEVTTISGLYQLDDNNLVMKDGEGNEISGEIIFVDGNHFSLKVNEQDLVFERI